MVNLPIVSMIVLFVVVLPVFLCFIFGTGHVFKGIS